MPSSSYKVTFDLPEHHRRWVRGALALAACAYICIILLHWAQNTPQPPGEIVALLCCLIGLTLNRKAPRLGGALGIFAIWFEIMTSLATHDEPSLGIVGMMALPVITVASSQLMGTRGGWTAALASILFAPAIVFYRTEIVGTGLTDRFVSELVIFVLTIVITASLLGSFFRTISELVARERKTAERTKELAVKLEQSQRIEAVAQLAGGVAHDFNNMLMTISGNADILQESHDPAAKEVSAELEAATERGSVLTRQLLTFARRDVVQEELVDVGKTVGELQRLFIRIFGKGVTLKLSADPDCFIRTDAAQLEQVLVNLAMNARDAMKGKGVFSISVTQRDKLVTVRIEDDGDGMDETELTHLFEPFYTTKGKEKGTGLGLSTVHGIVKRWQGSIEVQSQKGSGTVFFLSWPYEAQTAPDSVVRIRSSESEAARPHHILFVEDDPLARRSVTRMLKRNGFKVTVAVDGEEAWQLFDGGLRPDLLLSDVIMPGMTGAELALKVRDRDPSLPLLLVSGYLDDVLEKTQLDTTKDLLLKPFSSKDLMSRLHEKLNAA